MKRLIALMIILALALPSLALAVEEEGTLPVTEGETEEVEANTYAFTIFGFTFVVIPADKKVEGDSGTFAVIKNGEDEVGELLSNYRLGNLFGKIVSTMARITFRPLSERLAEEEAEAEGDIIPSEEEETDSETEEGTVPGEDEIRERPVTHGQVVSAFVHELIRMRREIRTTEQIESKDQLKLKIQDRVGEKIMLKLKIHDPEVEEAEVDAKNFRSTPRPNAKLGGVENFDWTAYENETWGQKKIGAKKRNHIKNGKTDEAEAAE
ncbi:MAG: hypothetical protein QMD53_05570 [Actinomycetota bacterium]|nr:hypothetical protein [Actinomycetota bacterium]